MSKAIAHGLPKFSLYSFITTSKVYSEVGILIKDYYNSFIQGRCHSMAFTRVVTLKNFNKHKLASINAYKLNLKVKANFEVQI